MQAARGRNEALGRKAKLAHSYQQLLDEFSAKELHSVGNYTLGRLIGKGSFGKVYLATHKLTNGSKVVLKSAKKDDSNLAREIHHHRQFVHPHIARLYEVIVTENMVWMVLEYCSGDELYNYLLAHGSLPVDKVQKIFAQLVGAVSYVHLQSCVHRDLKLENILLDKNENVKLVDFGFTREYEGKANYLQTFCGTICYSAPEMLKGEKYAGEKVDVWSLGIILYALLCGELPFDDDDDNVTRSKILSEEPKFPDHLPADGVALIKSLLSKRPLLRPALSDVLAHPFLADHAPTQQAILKVQQPTPFTTALEKETLHRMRSAGVDIDSIIESVLAQRCDALAGWWTLVLEKEERKLRRRERKRKEKDAELRSLRRLSAASGRLERLAPTLQDVHEEGVAGESHFHIGDPSPKTRGRSERRSAYNPDLQFPGLPLMPEDRNEIPPSPTTTVDGPPPPPIDKDSIRSVSTSRQHRPIPPPKEGVIRSARSRGSTLHLVTTPDAFTSDGSRVPPIPDQTHGKVRKKPSQAILTHWKNMTHWIFENTRRGRGQNRRGSISTPDLRAKSGKGGLIGAFSKESSPRPQTSKPAGTATSTGGGSSGARSSPGISPAATSGLPPGLVANGHANRALASLPGGPGSLGFNAPAIPPQTPAQAIVPRRTSSTSYKRQSLSPSPLTPRTAMRRSSAGLRGRKSTSSSVSSIRSIHHHQHTHSKASSTSSNGSVSTSMSKSTLHRGTSPHHSVKVLPVTPQSNGLPSNIRLVRGSGSPVPLLGFPDGPSQNQVHNMRPPGSPNPFSSGGVMFAKRKRNLFKGPMLNFGGGNSTSASGGLRVGSGTHSRSASASGLGRRSGEITIEEVDEDSNDEYVDEVEPFSPADGRETPEQKDDEIEKKT